MYPEIYKKPAIIRARTTDSMMTYDSATIDAAGSFLVGELERLDQTLHEPLFSTSWSRDIDLREDVTLADETSSFTNSTFAAAGGTSPNGKAWIDKDSTTIASLALDITKTPNPLTLWGMQIGWTIPELASAQKIGRPIDTDKYNGMQTKWNMDVDEQVYIGDAQLNVPGLVNNDAVNVTNAQNGSNGSPLWNLKSPDEILADVNALLNSVWKATGYAICPERLLLPPVKFSYLVSQKVSNAGNISILQYLKENSLSNANNGRPLEIYPLKWLSGRGTAGTDRMVTYTRDKKRVRFPLVPLQHTPIEYRDIRQLTTYFGRLGVVEFVYPETVGYMDGV